MKKTILFALVLTVGSIAFTSCSEQPLPEPEIIDLAATGDDDDDDDIPPSGPKSNLE